MLGKTKTKKALYTLTIIVLPSVNHQPQTAHTLLFSFSALVEAFLAKFVIPCLSHLSSVFLFPYLLCLETFLNSFHIALPYFHSVCCLFVLELWNKIKKFQISQIGLFSLVPGWTNLTLMRIIMAQHSSSYMSVYACKFPGRFMTDRDAHNR